MADSEKNLCCPACGEIMEKVYDDKNKIYIDICTQGCGGILFDNTEFQKYDEKHEDIDIILNKLEERTLKQVDTSAERVCPVCKAKMTKNKYGIEDAIEVDECYNCGAKFLDYGKLEAIRAQYDTEEERAKAFDDLIETKYGNELYKVEQEYNQISKNKSIIVKIARKIVSSAR